MSIVGALTGCLPKPHTCLPIQQCTDTDTNTNTYTNTNANTDKNAYKSRALCYFSSNWYLCTGCRPGGLGQEITIGQEQEMREYW